MRGNGWSPKSFSYIGFAQKALVDMIETRLQVKIDRLSMDIIPRLWIIEKSNTGDYW